MNGFAPDTLITGIAIVLRHGPGEWSIAKYDAFLARPDSVFSIMRTDGNLEMEGPLRAMPILCGWADRTEYAFPFPIRAGVIAEWRCPEEVRFIRLSISGMGTYVFVDMDAVRGLKRTPNWFYGVRRDL